MNTIFNTQNSQVPATNTTNAAGGKAYQLSNEAALAKYVCTGVFNDTYQETANDQVQRVLSLCRNVNPEFLAKLAVFSRKHCRMKDTPVFLTAYLARTNIELCKKVFSRVIDNPKILRNFVQVMRSGTIAETNTAKVSRSLGTASKKLVQSYFDSLTDEQLFKSNIGNKPSISDVIRLTHPKPRDKSREALYSYILGKPIVEGGFKNLPSVIEEYEAFKKDNTKDIPNVPFEMLTALNLNSSHWMKIAERATFNQARLNLNTFGRHGVFQNENLVKLIADRIANPDEVRKSRVLPYQLFTTYLNADVPQSIKNALQAAVEVSLENVPTIEGNLYIAVDVSGSMSQRVTGDRGSVTTKARYIDVAALFASAILRKNKNAVVLPFDTEVRQMDLNPFDSIMTNAQKLAEFRGGGTNCSKSLEFLNNKKATGSAVIYISDNESWQAYAGKKYNRSVKGTGMMHEWEQFTKRSPNARLINIDITPSDTTQTANVPNTLLCAGFSDFVFDVVAGFMRGDNNNDFWIKTIGEIKL